jgi:16S rRNA (guanine966-N2)-methyltransferase
LRIISGFAKGLRLKSPQGRTIRPTSDRAREALFNIIGDQIREAFVLDLFAGTGALGFESLSRGAQHVTFIDNSPDSLNLIKKNLQLVQQALANSLASGSHPPDDLPLAFCPPTLVIKYDLGKGGFFKKKLWKDIPSHYDVVFLDPPYAKGLSLQTLMYLDGSDFLNRGGIVVAEDTPATDLPVIFNSFKMIDKRRYGDTGFWIYKNIANAQPGIQAE